MWILCVDKALCSDGKNTVQAKQWFDKCYTESALLETMVKKWYADFKCCRTDKNGAEFSGRSNSAVVPENSKKLHKFVLADHKLKLHEIERSWRRYQKAVYSPFCTNICHLESCVESGCCVYPQSIKNNVLMIQRVVCNCFNATKRSFCINMWQWIKHESTTSLKSQIGSQLSGQQQVKAVHSDQSAQISASKVLASVFLDAQGILFIDYLEKGRTINNKYYIPLLMHLKEEISKKMATFEEEKVLFHQDNALCHKSIASTAKLHELHFELLPHPPYSPDLAPWLFADLKRMLQGKRFGPNELYFEAKDKSSYKKASNC